MAYRNKTYVAFASEDIHCYRLMQAWRENEHIEFDFLDAHDINTALDTSQPETIRRRLRERLANTKQSIVLLSSEAKRKAGLSTSFFYYEVEVVGNLELPVIFVNINGNRSVQSSLIPNRLGAHLYTISTSLQPKIVQYALDNYVPEFADNKKKLAPKTGPYRYKDHVYEQLGL